MLHLIQTFQNADADQLHAFVAPADRFRDVADFRAEPPVGLRSLGGDEVDFQFLADVDQVQEVRAFMDEQPGTLGGNVLDPELIDRLAHQLDLDAVVPEFR